MSSRELNYYKEYIQDHKESSSGGNCIPLSIEDKLYTDRVYGFYCIYSENNIKVFVEEWPFGSGAVSCYERDGVWHYSPSCTPNFYVFVNDEFPENDDWNQNNLMHEIETKYFIWRLHLKHSRHITGPIFH